MGYNCRVTVSTFVLLDGRFHADRVESQIGLFLDFMGAARDVIVDGAAFRQLFQIALGDHQVQQLESVFFLGMLLFSLQLARLAL